MKRWANNPLAPAWLIPGFDCAIGDRFFQYVIRVNFTAANQMLSDLPVLFDGDGCFMWCASGSESTVAAAYLHLRDHNGRYLSNQPFAVPGWAGVGGQHCPQIPAEPVPAGALWSLTAINDSADASGFLVFLLNGFKRAGGGV